MRLDPARVLRHRALRARLDRSATDAVGASRAVAALHGTDPATVHLSVWARTPARPIGDVAADVRGALEEDRSLVRVMAMRRTLHVVERSLAPAAVALAGDRLGKAARKLAERLLVLAGAATERTAGRVFERASDEVLAALGDDDLDTETLYERVPTLGMRVALAQGKAYESEAPVGRYFLDALSVTGRTVRARALGGWRQGGCTWARLDAWLPGLPPIPDLREAHRAIVEAWLRAFGPATVDDAAWWTGLPKRDVSAALKAARAVEVEVAGWGTRWSLDEEMLDGDAPIAFLPALDPSAMALQDRSPFLDPSWSAPLWDRSGNIAPTVWADGRIVGAWTSRKDGTVAWRLLDPSAASRGPEVEAEAARLQEALGGEVVRPRFPAPIVRELAG